MKRILIFSTAYHPRFVGGAEIAIKEITDRLGSDFEFDMVTIRFDSNLDRVERIGNVTVYRLGFTRHAPTMNDLVHFPLKLNKFLFPFMALFKATALYRKHTYGTVWGMMASFGGFGALFFKMTHMNVPFLLTLQEGDAISDINQKVRPVYPLFSRIFTRADFIQVISNYLGTWAKTMGFTGPLEVIPNGVDVAHFSRGVTDKDIHSIRQSLGLNGSTTILVHTGRAVKKNALDDVIKSLLHTSEEVHFLQIGSGPDTETLSKLAQDLGIHKRVHFLDYMSNNKLPAYLKASDIFIRPSLSEGMGNSFIEAMAAGIPIIATQEGGIKDFLYDPELNPNKAPTGRAVPTRSPKEIARQVKMYLSDKKMTQKIVENAKVLVRERHDWDLVAKNMKEKVFDKLIK